MVDQARTGDNDAAKELDAVIRSREVNREAQMWAQARRRFHPRATALTVLSLAMTVLLLGGSYWLFANAGSKESQQQTGFWAVLASLLGYGMLQGLVVQSLHARIDAVVELLEKALPRER